MAYVPNAQLTDAYLQRLITRNGFQDVTAQNPWGCLYVIQDLDGSLRGFDTTWELRNWLNQQYQIINPTGASQSTDQAYPDGTVVCPDAAGSGNLIQCTHDNCPFAVVYSGGSIISSGSVSVKTAFSLAPRTHVVSDGRGAVRAAAVSEQAHVIGITTGPTATAQVPIIIRDIFGVVA